jgi:hypothetical protein
MSFSFTAGGTRDQTIASLDAVAALTDDGVAVRDLVRGFIADGPGGDDAASGGAQLRYDVHAWGHHAPGGVPSLNVSLTCGYPG